MTYETRHFINNEYVDSKDQMTFEVYNPTNDEFITEVPAADSADVDAAYTAAKNAFKGWRSTPAQQRAAILNKFADLLERDSKALMKAERECMGVPIAWETSMMSHLICPIVRYYAGWCDKLGGESYPVDGDGTVKFVRYEPLGVCAAISAWNGSLLSVAMKLAPALAVGNTVIHKSSEKTPLGCLMLGKLAIEAGFPPGVVNFISGAGETGALLASHMHIAKVAFTGSAATGRRVQEAAAKSNLKRVTLELGGKSASVVFNDADLENAMVMNTFMFLMNSGQACVAGTRVFVQEEISEKFIAGMKEQFEQLAHVMGDPNDYNIQYGPLADKLQSDRVMGFIEAGKAAGAEVLVGGERKGGKGNYVLPTIFINADDNNPVYQDEIFGPVLTVRTFKTEEEAIELANDTDFGLAAYCYTKDLSRAMRLGDALEAGNVGINTTSLLNVNTPFGGYKQSGIGKECGIDGLMAYVNKKTINIKI